MTPDELVAKSIAPIKPEFLVQRQASAPAAAQEPAKVCVSGCVCPSLAARGLMTCMRRVAGGGPDRRRWRDQR